MQQGSLKSRVGGGCAEDKPEALQNVTVKEREHRMDSIINRTWVYMYTYIYFTSAVPYDITV